MGISSAMNASVMGLQVQSSKLSTISDNIANSETKGYKRANMEFASLVLSEKPSTYDAGGVRAATVRDIESQGAVVGTSNILDLALSGKGFLPVTTVNQVENPDKPLRLVRTGAFRPDAQGYLRTTNGFALLGWKPGENDSFDDVARESTASLEPVRINNVGLAADPTASIRLALNLDDRQTGVSIPPGPSPDPMFTMPVEFFDKLGGSGQLKFEFYQTTTARTWKYTLKQQNGDGSNVDLSSGEIKFDEEGKLAADGVKAYVGAKPSPDPSAVAEGLAQTALAATKTDLDTAGTNITAKYSPITPELATANTAANDAYVSAKAALDAAQTAIGGSQVSLPSVKTAIDAAAAAFADAETEFTKVTTAAASPASNAVQDLAALNAGTAKLKEALNYITSANSELAIPLVPATVSGANSAAYNSLSGNLELQLGSATGGQKINVYVGKPGTSDGLQGLKSNFSPYITKDGSPASPMRSIEVDEEGNLNALFESGFRRTLYRIPVGQVVNPNGLTSLDGPAYAISSKSGGIYFYDAGTGPVGRMVASALEESTTDVAEELTQLIKTQRAYSSNAKIIQTVDEMLQETTNLKR